MGKANSVLASKICRISFPRLKLALVVRICGGVPFCSRYPDEFEIRGSVWSITGRSSPELRGPINKLKGRTNSRWMQERTCLHLQTLLAELGSGSSSVTLAVHFGYISRAGQVMKLGEDRDSISRETGVIAFEMEGAGNYVAATAAALYQSVV
ncbi:hypothetical protein LZ31DRAFT_568816 [Colletotrichum somersetense]|nr:hypothetical protein LZ31DRAFT_568816 [Colletotrichum somersetense]